MSRNDNANMYTGEPCNACGGPTLRLGLGSIWCPAEDPHPGGHFNSRVAFERTPAKQAAYEARGGRKAIAPRPISAPRAAVAKPAKSASPFAGGMDDFVESDR